MIRLGTRGSQLAMAQSTWVRKQLESAGHEVELIQLKTEGDVKTGPLAQIGGQGLFTKRLQDALQQNEIDLAVHSLKDLPTQDLPDLTLAAVPEREDPRDALVSESVACLEDLPTNAIVGTGSVRRAAQLLHLRPDLEVRDIRGNVDTRLRKLTEESFDAIILASAGLRRLGLEDKISFPFGLETMLPAVGQGCLGLEVRVSDQATKRAVAVLNHEASQAMAIAERAMLKALFAGCLAPVGAHTVVSGDQITLTGVVLSRDGIHRVVASASDECKNSASLGAQVAQQLIQQGAQPLLETVH